MTVFETRREKKATSIGARTAASFVLLAYDGKKISEIHKKLKILKDSGYNIRGLGFRSAIENPGYKSDELSSFLSVLDASGYRHFGDPLSLTEKGVNLLERKVLQEFVENHEFTERFARDAGLDLNQIIKKHLEKYLSSLDPK